MRTPLRRVAPMTVAAALIAVTAAMLATTYAAPAGARDDPRAAPATDWTTYHHDGLRTGDGVISGTFASLHPSFRWDLPTATASERSDQIFASPLVVGTTAFVTTLENRVYAISLTTHRTLWARQLGAAYTPPSGVCGNIGPNVGIVSTGAIDESRGELYVVADVGLGKGGQSPVHRLFGLSIATGKTLLDRDVDPPGQQSIYLLQRASLAIDKGRVIFGFGGNAGDCGSYHGWVISVPEHGGGAIDRYEVAKVDGVTDGKGAVWMGGGAPVIDAHGDLYVADGNGDATSLGNRYDLSDAVLKLTPTMRLLDWFAPTTWYSDNAGDADLGSGQPELLPDGRLFQIGKTQTVYVLNPNHLGHIDGSVPTFTMCSGLGDQNAYGGDAIVGPFVVIPCGGGLDAARFSSSPPYGTEVWSQTATAGPPVYAAGLIWSIDPGSGTLFGLYPATGTAKVQYTIGSEQNHFPTPAIGDNMVVAATQTSLYGFPPG
jgi:outer membrane protein assembly factor BamB